MHAVAAVCHAAPAQQPRVRTHTTCMESKSTVAIALLPFLGLDVFYTMVQQVTLTIYPDGAHRYGTVSKNKFVAFCCSDNMEKCWLVKRTTELYMS